MRRHLAVVAAAVLVLAGSACGTDSEPLDEEALAACDEYHRLINQWSTDYGAELGAVGEAEAAGDQGRRRTAVAVVRELFATTASELRAQAGQTSHPDLSGALADAADGLDEIAEQIDTYDDATTAPELMSGGAFADAGQRVSGICAG